MSSYENPFKLDAIAPLIKQQFPDFFLDEESKLPTFLDHYYRYLECQHFHFKDIFYSEYRPALEDDISGGIELESGNADCIILESKRNDKSAFEVGEIITGDTSKATGEIRGLQKDGTLAGKHTNTSPHHLFVFPLTGKFQIGETFTGSANRTRATLSAIDDKGALGFSRKVMDVADIYNTDDEFVEIFRKEFIPNIPRTAKTSLKKLIPLAKNIYKSRGSENSFTFLWRSVYDKNDLEFLYPKDFIFKVSGAAWNQDLLLFVDGLTATNSGSFAGRRVTGTISQATAIVQKQSGITRGSNVIIQLFISDLEGTFLTGERIESAETSDGIKASGTTVAAVNNINVIDGGTNYKVGDKLTITGGGGVEATASVNTVTDGAVNEIVIADGGDGYFGNELFEYFIPSTGSGASGQATANTPSGVARVYGNTITVSSFASTQINSADFGGDLSGVNANNHFYSNANNTFDITVGSSANYAVGMFVASTGNTTIGTVVGVPDATSIIYALPDETLPNFYPGTNGSTISAYNADGTAVGSTSTTVSAITSVSDTQFFGVLSLQEIPYGSIKTAEVLTVGKEYDQAPTIRATQSQIADFNNDDGILGPRSRFLNFDTNIQFLFKHGNQIQGETSGAAGTVLDPFIESSSNSTFSVLRYKKDITRLVIDSTDGSSNAGENLLLEDGFAPSHGSYSSDTSFAGQFKMEDVDFTANETVLQLTTTANAISASQNVVTIDNTRRGNNAVIQSGNLSIGAITSVSITDFGVGFSSVPNVTAQTGDQNANLVATIGASAQKGGEYSNEDSLLSGKDKIQDSYYYQDYSYVLKTDLPVNSFRDTVKSFIHPAGWALFGEISFKTDLTLQLDFDDNRQFKRVLEIDPFSVNFMSANANISQYYIRFIEATATIVFTPTYANEFIYRFPEPSAITLTNDSILSSPEIEYFLALNVQANMYSIFNKEVTYEIALNAALQNVVDEINFEKYLVPSIGALTVPASAQERHFETTRTASVTHSGVQRKSELEVSPVLAMSATTVEETLQTWVPIEGSSFTDERISSDTGVYVVRTMPTIQDWYNSYSKNVPSDLKIEYIYNQQINLLAGPQYTPSVEVGDEIYLPTIREVDEDGLVLLDDGDNVLLEDGMSPLDVLTAQSLEAAEALVTGDIVIQNANGTVSKANTTNITASNFKGIVNGSFSATQTASVLGNGFTTHVTSRTLTVDATHYVTGTSPFFSTTPGTPSVVLGKGVANNGVTSTYTAGENLTNGDFIMLNGSNQAVKLDMSAATTTVQSDVHEFPFLDAANTYATSISIDKNSSNTTSGTFGITYVDNSSGYRQKLRLATYSGTPTDIDITYGTEVDLGSGGIEDFMDMQFSETTGKFLHICNETIRGGYYSGTTPTLGTAMTVTAYKPACDPNPNNGAQWLYARQDSSTGKVSIITMGSGATTTSLTQGTEVEYDTGNSSRTAKIEWDPHTSGRFVITWRRSNEGGDMYTRIGSVSGTTITWDGSIYEVGSANGTENYEMHWDPMQSNQILYTYNDKDGYNYPPRVRVGTVGSGGAITFGTETLLYDDPNDTGDEGVNHVRAEFFQDTGKIMFVVASSVTASKGYYLFGQLSNSGTLTLDTSVTQFSTDYIYHTDMDSVGSLILTSFEDGNTYGGASGDDGSYVFAATDVASFDSSDFIGVVDANYTSGATATVQGMGMTDDAQSGLDGSSIYYFTDASPAGLSTTGTIIAGKAISATQIKIGDPTKTNSVLVGGEAVAEYSGTTSAHGQLVLEGDEIVYEDSTHVSINRKGIPFWQKEEYKYNVKGVNSTAYTVEGASHSTYLPVGLNDFNTEAFVLRNKSSR